MITWTDQSNCCIPWSYNVTGTRPKRSKSDKRKLNVEGTEFRSKRTAVVIALAKTKEVAEHDESDND